MTRLHCDRITDDDAGSSPYLDSQVVWRRVVVRRRTGGPLGLADQVGEGEVIVARPAEYEVLVILQVQVYGRNTAKRVPPHIVQPERYY